MTGFDSTSTMDWVWPVGIDWDWFSMGYGLRLTTWGVWPLVVLLQRDLRDCGGLPMLGCCLTN